MDLNNRIMKIIHLHRKRLRVSLKFCFNNTLFPDLIAVFAERREQVPFSKAIGNVELMHECFIKHLLMRTATME